jgi:voltage-gated potassium channel
MRSRSTGRRWLGYALPTAALVVVLAGGGFAALETDTVASFWEGVWWALVLSATVGFVDTPTTLGGKLVSALVSVFGFILLAVTTAAFSSVFVREDEAPVEARDELFETRVLHEIAELRAQIEGLREGGPDPGSSRQGA